MVNIRLYHAKAFEFWRQKKFKNLYPDKKKVLAEAFTPSIAKLWRRWHGGGGTVAAARWRRHGGGVGGGAVVVAARWRRHGGGWLFHCTILPAPSFMSKNAFLLCLHYSDFVVA